MGGILGGLLGGGSSGADQNQLAALQNAALAFQQYRPEAMQGRLNALSNISTAYQPANNLLQTMYGGQGSSFMDGLPPMRGNKI